MNKLIVMHGFFLDCNVNRDFLSFKNFFIDDKFKMINDLLDLLIQLEEFKNIYSNIEEVMDFNFRGDDFLVDADSLRILLNDLNFVILKCDK